MARSILIEGVSYPVRLGNFSLVESARNGEVGQGGFDIDSENAGFDINPHWDVRVRETDAGSNDIFVGYMGDRDIARGPFATGADRQFDFDLVDLNTLLGDRILRGSANRPAETDIARVTWLSTTGSGGAFTFNIGSTGAKNMDKADYRGRYMRDVLADCAEMAGKLFFAYWDPDTDQRKIFYDLATASNYNSPYAISTTLSEVNSTSVFAPRNISRRLDGGRIYSGVEVRYNGGKVMVQDTAVSSNYRRRETSIYDDRIKTAAKARARAEKFIAASAAEEEVISCEVDVTSSQILHFRTGQRVSVKAPHLGIPSPVYRRIVHREVKPRGGGDAPDSQDYTLALELSNPKTVRWSNFGTPAPENDASQGGSSLPPPPAGEASACEFLDSFTRTVSDGLGSSDFGVPWTNITGTADRDVDGSHAVFTSSTNGQERAVEWNSSELVSAPWWIWPDATLEATVMFARFKVTSKPSTGSFDFHFIPGGEQWALRFSGTTLSYGYVNPLLGTSLTYALNTYYIAEWRFDGVDRQRFAVYEEGTEPSSTSWVEGGIATGDSIFKVGFYNNGTAGTSTFALDYIKFCPPAPCETFDDFNRTVAAGGWGTASSGADWAIEDPFLGSNDTSVYSVDGSYGLITSTFDGPVAVATGGYEPWAQSKWTMTSLFKTGVFTAYPGDHGDVYYATANDAGEITTITLYIGAGVYGGVDSSFSTVAAFAWVSNTWYYLKWEHDGATNSVRVWKTSEAEPTTWLITGTDPTDTPTEFWVWTTTNDEPYTHTQDTITFCPDENAPAFGQTVLYEFVAIGDGVTTAYTTNYPYRPGTLRIYIDMLPEVNVIETDPSTGAFTITGAPFNTEEIYVSYEGTGS